MSDHLRCIHGVVWPDDCNPCDYTVWRHDMTKRLTELGANRDELDVPDNPITRLARARTSALAAAASGGDVKQAPGEAPQSGPNEDSGNAQRRS